MKWTKKIVLKTILLSLFGQISMAQSKAYWTCTECAADNQRSCILVVSDPVQGERIVDGDRAQIRQACATPTPNARVEARPAPVARSNIYFCTTSPMTERQWGFAGCGVIGGIVGIGELCNRAYYRDAGVYVALKRTDNERFSERMANIETCEAQARSLNGQ